VLDELYDRRVARHLTTPTARFLGFVGNALRSFQQARRLGVDRLELVAANSHVQNVKNAHDRAAEGRAMDDSWLNPAQVRKTLREYDAADTIYVHSKYTRRSFERAGVDPAILDRTYLYVHPRFRPPEHRPQDDTFRIVYVGRVDTTKGIPHLFEAFSQLSVRDATLTVVGGWSTRSMRTYVETRLDEDDRIRVAPGDPLPALHAVDVLVHPSYEDGFGYAPMEALACGVPVVVTADTGMKEYVDEEINGYVVPTGSTPRLVDALERVYQNPLAGTVSLLPDRYWQEREKDTVLDALHYKAQAVADPQA
jgi:glycosyltransferase involved in cell wall biosynthesis